MNKAQQYNQHRLYLQHHLNWNVISPPQSTAWQYLDSKRCQIDQLKTQPSPMNWVDIDIRRN